LTGETVLFLARSVKLLAEVAALALLGQLCLGALLGPAREGNLVYVLLAIVSRPLRALVAWVLPVRWSQGVHIVLALMVAALVWLAALVAKVQACQQLGMHLCR
jgi:hypothetical protein